MCVVFIGCVKLKLLKLPVVLIRLKCMRRGSMLSNANINRLQRLLGCMPTGKELVKIRHWESSLNSFIIVSTVSAVSLSGSLGLQIPFTPALLQVVAGVRFGPQLQAIRAELVPLQWLLPTRYFSQVNIPDLYCRISLGTGLVKRNRI